MKKIFLFFVVLIQAYAQETVSFKFELDQNPANWFIALEYAKPTFPKEFTFPYSGSIIKVTMSQPAVEFKQSFMQLVTVLTAEQIVNGNIIATYQYPITPQIKIYVDPIPLDKLQTEFEDFATYINNTLSSWPQTIRNEIIEKYNSLKIPVFIGKIISEANNATVPDNLAVTLIPKTPIFVSTEGKLVINIESDIKGNYPEFMIYTLDNARKFKIVSNFRATLTSWEFDAASHNRNWDGELVIEKGGEAIFDLTNNGQLAWNSAKILKVWYRNERGVFFREYLLSKLNTGWVGPHPVSTNTWDY